MELVADVLVIGGGPAGAWAALTARSKGAEVVLVDKGFFGTSGATAPSNTETWVAAPGPGRAAAVARHLEKTRHLADADHLERVLHHSFDGLRRMIEWGYPFPPDAFGKPYIGNLRGPDYMRFMRRRVIGAGVQVFDHHPAVELTADAEGVGGAEGVDRQLDVPWSARASAVVLATGGCAFGERFIGATGLTGDGLLMAAEVGATLSGMEMSSQYAVAPAGSSLNKGMPYRFATFLDCDGNDLGELGDDRQVAIARAMQKGPVFARLDKASEVERDWLRRGQPNCFLPYDRLGIDPFSEKFEITLRAEGTVRGVGGVQLTSSNCETGVPGLFAAGDVASREDLMGAVTGGGGPNSSWAIASGICAGGAAGELAMQNRRTRDSRVPKATARFGIGNRARAPDVLSARDITAAVRATMLPLPINFFRSEGTLSRSRQALDKIWDDVPETGQERSPLSATTEQARLREATAMLACARWSLAGAIARRETRGMHRRTDYPEIDAKGPRRLRARGLERIELAVGGGWRESP